MSIEYLSKQDFKASDLEELFLSVEWSSGKYPDKLATAMKNSGAVFSAWDVDKLVGLVNVLDDGVMTAYIHYMLVHPDYHDMGIGRKLIGHVKEKYKNYLRIAVISYNTEIDFYKNCGFTGNDKAGPMFITSLWT